MQEYATTATMDELDLELITALQAAPRAPWAQLAGPLGVDAATLSRRWARLRDSGAAWVTCYSGASQVAYGALALIEVTCLPQAREALAARCALHPQALSVELVAGSGDLLLTVATTSRDMMTEYVLALGRIPEVTGTRTHLVQHLHREGSQWRFDSLSRDQRRGLPDHSPGPGPDPGPVTREERRLMLALAPDGRRSLVSLATELDRPESTVRRLLAGVLGSGKAVLRCEAAQPYTGWHTSVTLWISVPPTELGRVASELAALRDTRLSASTATEANLLAVVWAHGTNDIARYEARIAANFRDLRILNRAVTLRWIKRMGRVIGPDGSSQGCVPMDVWADVRA
ncbi:Lrp/AsnC family transcriptional regulator [Streptomyces sp. NPDC058620]|uniref:Lrp/AsnC family transcriptional regulator n=1 Tax=Streptomyces sp. NPDC058620 TaxID=3346560 RepID=UPI003652E34F